MRVRLLIGTPNSTTSTLGWTDYTAQLVEREWTINKKAGSLINTTTFQIHDANSNLDIDQGLDVVIEEWTNPSVRKFGGTIAQVRTRSLGVERDHFITAQSYTLLADRATVRKTYETSGQTDRAVILDAVSEAGLTELDTSQVQEGRTIDDIDFQGVSFSALMDQITEITGFVWEIDDFKVLHYHPKTFQAGTFTFSDAPDNSSSFPYYDAELIRDLAQWNAVTLEGGHTISADIVDVYSNSGGDTVFTLGQQAGTSPLDREPTTANDTNPYLLIEENTGTDGSPVWTTRTVRIEAEPSTSGDVTWNPLNRRLVWASAPPSFATNSFRVTGRTLIPTRVINRDTKAIAIHGRTFMASLIVPEATDVNQAEDISMAYLRDHSDKLTVQFKHNQDNMEICTLTRVNSTRLNLTEELIYVFGQTTRLLGAETAEYTVGVEIINPDLFR